MLRVAQSAKAASLVPAARGAAVSAVRPDMRPPQSRHILPSALLVLPRQQPYMEMQLAARRHRSLRLRRIGPESGREGGRRGGCCRLLQELLRAHEAARHVADEGLRAHVLCEGL